jgi:hypothetical protein
MPDVDPIAHLDWPVCQCAAEATHRIEIHALNHCNTRRDDLNADGNHTLQLCAPCYQTLRAKVADHVVRLTQFGRPTCLSCGAPVTCVKQVIREAKKL